VRPDVEKAIGDVYPDIQNGGKQWVH
jgi:hypothetical protein